MFIKSKKARNYEASIKQQVAMLGELMTGRLRMDATVYYRTERPDLDVSLILDGLQGRIYKNDRQVREQHLYHRIDRDNPRAEIIVTPIDMEE